MIRYFRILLITFSVAVFAGCSSQQTSTTKDKPVVLLLLNTYDNEFFRKIEEGFRAGMPQDLKDNCQVDVRYCSKVSDVSYQRRELDHYFSSFVAGRSTPQLKGLAIVPAGSNDEVTLQIKQLKDNHVPVVVVDLRIKPEAFARAHTDYDSYIGSRNKDGGVLAGEQMAKYLPKGGNVLVLNGMTGMEASIDRRNGFVEKLTELGKKNGVTYKIVERTGNFVRGEGQSIVDGLLSMGQQPDGIFAANDEMALGALEALRQSKKDKKTIVIGFDATQEAVKAVADGKMIATIAQDPVGLGSKAAETISALMKGQTVEKDQLLSPKVIDRDNIPSRTN
jgi:ribose transport system substrate-binding protein